MSRTQFQAVDNLRESRIILPRWAIHETEDLEQRQSAIAMSSGEFRLLGRWSIESAISSIRSLGGGSQLVNLPSRFDKRSTPDAPYRRKGLIPRS